MRGNLNANNACCVFEQACLIKNTRLTILESIHSNVTYVINISRINEHADNMKKLT